MDAKQAIDIAKDYVENIYKSEGAFNIGLEEVLHSPHSDNWSVTIGFSRPWDRRNFATIITQPEKRTYKIVEIADSGHVVALKNRKIDDDL